MKCFQPWIQVDARYYRECCSKFFNGRFVYGEARGPRSDLHSSTIDLLQHPYGPLTGQLFEVSLHLWETSLYNYASPILSYTVGIICLVLLWPVHAINLCCTIVGPSYTMSAQHKSNIGSASFICAIEDLLLCKTKKIPAVLAQRLLNHSLLDVGTSS